MTPPVTYLGKHENVDFRVSKRQKKFGNKLLSIIIEALGNR